MHHECRVTANYNVVFSTDDDEAIILYADDLAKARGISGLDSWDLGDAMGEIIHETNLHYMDEDDAYGTHLLIAPTKDDHEGFTITIETSYEPFAWGLAVDQGDDPNS